MLPIRIMTRDFQLLGETSQYESLQIPRSWHGISTLELRINRYKRHAEKMQRGNIIFPHNRLDCGYVIRHKEIELDERGKITENWIIRALSLKAWFLDRLTNPPEGQSYDRITADAESVMRNYVINNVVNPHDAGDLIDDIGMSENLNRGNSIEWQSRYKVLAEEMAEIGLLSGFGWNIEIDYEAKKYVFKVLEGRDLTAGQSDNPPAIFSPEFGTLKQLNYVESELDYKNFAVVAGQGEGAERRIVTVGDAVGADRRVLFVDARDVEEETDDDPPQPIPVEQIEERLRNRGLQKLAEHNQEIFMEGQALMGRVTEKVDSIIEGTLPDTFIDPLTLDVLFVSPFQTIEDTDPVIIEFNPINLARLGHYRRSTFSWVEDAPFGTNVTVQYSLDNENWNTLQNGGALPIDADERVTGMVLYIRQILRMTDHENFPSIRNFKYEIIGFTTREVISTARLLYGRDYDLGDVVTLQNKGWGVTLDARITEVKEIYEPGKTEIELTFGNDRPTLISKIKQELSGVKMEMTR